jgi:glycosyltransferase involved in cell wall biosynthesis
VPVKNEAHNLPRFLACAALWADRIIVADQCSEDASREICQSHPKVTLISNPSRVFNEPERQALLLSAAREIPGPRIIAALDADEALASAVFDSPLWEQILSSKPGTVCQLRFVDLLPGMRRVRFTHWMSKIYVDDGRPHQGQPIHSPPVPVYPDTPILRTPECVLLHYAMSDGSRYARRQVWYQCMEILNSKNFGPIQIYRRYHAVDAIPPEELGDVDPNWFTAYDRAGIDMLKIEPGPTTMYDREIFGWMTDRNIGTKRFSKLAIWEVDWNREHEKFSGKPSPVDLRDPRGWDERAVHRWLARTQPKSKAIWVRLIQRALRLVGW